MEQENATLALSAEAYARMGIAVADAFIGCWNAKYIYNLVRPVTYIQHLIDKNWMPLVNTPPFPEYPSGHSVQTGAAAVVLAGMFGKDYPFTDHTHDGLGLATRSFPPSRRWQTRLLCRGFMEVYTIVRRLSQGLSRERVSGSA